MRAAEADMPLVRLRENTVFKMGENSQQEVAAGVRLPSHAMRCFIEFHSAVERGAL